MQKNNASRVIVNRRRVRRRRKAIPAPRPIARSLLLRLARSLRRGIADLAPVIVLWRVIVARKTGILISWLRQAAKAAFAYARLFILAIGRRGLSVVSVTQRGLSAIRRYLLPRLVRFWAVANAEVELPRLNLAPFFLRVARPLQAVWRRGLTAVSVIRRDLSAIRRYLLVRLGRFWAVANTQVELPKLNLAPFFRVVGVLLAIATVSISGFVGWQTIRDDLNMDRLANILDSDHQAVPSGPEMETPLAPDAVAQGAAAQDVETQFVTLASGPEDDDVDIALPEPGPVARAPDIDARNQYETATVIEPDEGEELAVLSLAPSPRARNRPELPGPAVAGISILPVPPMGTAPPPPAWLANAVEPGHLGKGPMIAIVIDDAGVAQKRTKRASELPAPITIAFIPYSDNLGNQTRYARSRGHELLLHIPMEPSSADIDPGHNALLTTLGEDEIMRRFRWALDRFDGYVGVNNHMGSKFMARGDLVRPVLEEINARGLLFLDSRTDHNSVGTRLARDIGMPNATRNIFIDNDLDAVKIRARLTEVEQVARRRGYAIAIGHPHDVTTEVLAEWIPEARRKGFQLVPVSAIVKQEYGPRLAAVSAGGEAEGLLGGAQ